MPRLFLPEVQVHTPIPGTLHLSRLQSPQPDLVAGTYTVTVTDGGGCTAIATVTITEPATPVTGSISSSSNVSVPGGSNGAVTVTATGGISPYLYSFESGAYQASGTFGGLAAGAYTVTVQDMNLCTFDVPVTISEPSAILSGSITSQTNVACFGASTGSVTVDGVGGFSPYDFSLDGSVFQPSGTFANLAAGDHIITVRDAGTITADVNFTITEPASSVGGAITSQTNVLCTGTNTGNVTVEGSGGTPPYQFRLGTGSYQSSGTFSALSAGSYIVTVQDANLCTFDVPLVITEPLTALAINAVSTSNATCAGSATGQITVSGCGRSWSVQLQSERRSLSEFRYLQQSCCCNIYYISTGCQSLYCSYF